jgi:hypothetical protein
VASAVSEISTGTRVHRRDEREPAWIRDRATTARDAHDPIFYGRAQSLKRVSAIEGELVEEKDSVVYQGWPMTPEKPNIFTGQRQNGRENGTVNGPFRSGRKRDGLNQVAR